MLWIGRDADCHVRLTEDGVSDRHAAIERREDGYYLCDLDSATGVRVGEQRVKQHRLASGDDVEVGAAKFRFEILHGVGTPRRTVDALQLAALTIVGALILGQLGLFAWIFTQPHPAGELTRPERAALPTVVAPDSPVVPPAPRPAPPVAPVLPAPRPVVLTRMIRIDRVNESLDDGRLLLTVQAKAQVGERVLDPRAVGLCVQFYFRNPDDSVTLWRHPLWLKIPDWDNFTSKAFTALFPGGPDEYGGYVVRSYYRDQLQDAVAKPISLLAQTPEPMVK